MASPGSGCSVLGSPSGLKPCAQDWHRGTWVGAVEGGGAASFPVPWWARVTSQIATAAGQREQQEPGDEHPHPVADPERNPALSARGQRPQHRRDLPGGAPRAGGLDRQHVLQVGDQLRIVGVAVLLTLGRGVVDDGGERGGHLRPLGLHVGQHLPHVLHRHGDLVLALERNLSGEHLVEHDAERVEIGLAGDVLPEGLLGGDVVGGAEHAPVGGQPLLVQRPGDPEVGDLGRALLVDHHVLGL